MNMVPYFQSISNELSSLQQRVRHLMDDPHWVTDGEWKESVLRNILRRYLPETIKVGRGFIYTKNQCSTQIDVLLYDSSYPIIFKDGDLVFVTPDAVRGIIEVKSKINTQDLSRVFSKLASNAEIVNRNILSDKRPCFTGLFSFENNNVREAALLKTLNDVCAGNINKVITHICLGTCTFVRFWTNSPERQKNIWHSYALEKLAPAYFITNVLESVSPSSINTNSSIWFPLENKEINRSGTKELKVNGN
ncbi:DUF6602 domain-containing protein [Planococcus soli]|uniref:DUF6602 domain-containing protein n=1 Tax=Planococcus soli TaxID=2666072 RepID=UPI00115F3DC7|nr:DUF6602 domain-containing protein [Planococcus soli]